MKPAKLMLFIACLAGAWFGGYGYGRWYGPGSGAGLKGKAAESGYHCPMHPNVRSDRPGDCPICGMKLVPDANEPAPKQQGQGRILHYRDPQKHSYTSDKPGLNPETGNNLEPVFESDSKTMPAGVIHIPADRQQLIGVRWGMAEWTIQGRQFRTTGKVTVDERRVTKVQTRIDGWIEKVFVDFVGRRVEKGEPLLTIYSPELLASQQEYILALRSRELLSRGSTGESLMAAARRRLELLELSADQIEEIERSGKPSRTVTITAPASGIVTLRNAFPKQRVTPETELYSITALDRVWVMAEVFESDARLIREGAVATVSAAYAGGSSARARVDYIQPEMDPMTRTIKVRLEMDNPGLRLKPEMYVDVDFCPGGTRRLTVDSEAVLDSGRHQTVFVDLGEGHIEPRPVTAGERFAGRTEILSGLKAGERVAVSGNFLLDSESRLKAAARGVSQHHD